MEPGRRRQAQGGVSGQGQVKKDGPNQNRLKVAGLSFIGLGAKLPTPEWGLMIAEGRQYIVSGEWWVTLFPGLFIMLGVTGFTLIGDGLREVLNPKLRIQ